MEAGKLNSRVKIQQLAAGQDSIGQPVQTWSDVATVWANIKSASGVKALEAMRAGADSSITLVSMRVRRRTDITAAMRVSHGTVIYNITGVLPDEQAKTYMDLVCSRIN